MFACLQRLWCMHRKAAQEAATAEAAPLVDAAGAAVAGTPSRGMWDPLLAALASGHVWCVRGLATSQLTFIRFVLSYTSVNRVFKLGMLEAVRMLSLCAWQVPGSCMEPQRHGIGRHW